MGKEKFGQEEYDCINNRINEIRRDYPSTSWTAEGAIIPEMETMPPELKAELEQLEARREELRNLDDECYNN